MTTLLQKSVDNSNYQRIKAKVDLEALIQWSRTEPDTLPEYKKSSIVKNKFGWKNFINNLRP